MYIQNWSPLFQVTKSDFPVQFLDGSHLQQAHNS